MGLELHLIPTSMLLVLISGEMATYLTGRYVEIKMLPSTFKEFLHFKKLKNTDPARHLSEYLEYGGFPSVVLQTNSQLKRDVLSGIYNSILLRLEPVT